MAMSEIPMGSGHMRLRTRVNPYTSNQWLQSLHSDTTPLHYTLMAWERGHSKLGL